MSERNEQRKPAPVILTTGYLNDKLNNKHIPISTPTRMVPAVAPPRLAVPGRGNPPAALSVPGKNSIRQMSNNTTRQKVILKPGHSALDWESTKRSAKVRSVVPPYPMRINKEELARHNSLDDYWIVINRKVYNLTPYLDFHPGGIDILKSCAGKDGTSLFNKYHPWINADRILDACLVGFLV